MRIAIDARMIRRDSMHGIARYTFHLIEELARLSTSHEIFVLVATKSPLLERSWPSHIALVEAKSKWISLHEQWEIPQILRKYRIDLFHAPSFVAPLFTPCRLVMTIHDLNHLVLPQFYTTLHQFYYQFFVRRCIRQSEFILTVSHFSKAEIVRNLQLPSDKVFVTYNGVSERYQRIEDQNYLQYVREIYELPERFILCVSNNKPHKNIHQLVRAYCFANIDVPLVLACPVDRQVIQISENYRKKHSVRFCRFIEEEHLPAVYSLTHLFVYPSTYEGFGLPPLEALSCGVPVVVARSSSLPEVVGEHAIFSNPYDYKEMAGVLEVGVYDEQVRQKVIETGMKHSQQFSWRQMASSTLEVYDRCTIPARSTPRAVPV